MPARVQLVRLLLIFAFFGLWELGSRLGWLDPIFFGRPSAVFLDFAKMVMGGEVFLHAWVTLEEALIGFGLGAVLGILLAFALAASPFWARVLDPVIFLLYGIPRIALAPLFILWFGLGIASKVVFAFVLVLFLVFFNTFAGLKGVDRDMVNAVRVMGASRGQLLGKVIFPAISPWVMAGLKSGVGMSLLGAIVGEYVGGNAGLGWMINSAAGLFETTRVFSALLALGLLVLGVNQVLNWLEGRLLKWRPKNKLME
jgi:NitT/TauT family transport system permease protein